MSAARVGRAAQQPHVTYPRPECSAELLGSSAAMEMLRHRIAKVAAAPSDLSVMIEGETGTGKELVARAIHDQSRRQHGPFVAVNCAAIVDSLLEAELFGIEDRTATGVRGRVGKFEAANGGTLFLDEIADLPLAAQAKLLRVLQDRAVERVGRIGIQQVDIRIIGASNRSLREMVDRREFRLDLFHRLNCLDVFIPPLRARREDIRELASAVLQRHKALRHVRLAPEALDALMSYDWPGNVRELERAVVRGGALSNGICVGLDDLPPEVTRGYTDILSPSLVCRDNLRTWAGRYARMTLERHGHNRTATCQALGVSFRTLRKLLRDAPSSTDASALDLPIDDPESL
jgi:transcriptional regulator with PAS, ATPase and Fis domain